MIHLTRLLVFTFIEEFATVLVHRGVYFYTREALGFGETENLLLALCMGAVYVIGALPSHRVADWFGNIRAVLCLLAGQIAMLALVYHRPQGWMLTVLLGLSPKGWRVLLVLPIATMLWGVVSVLVAHLVGPGSPIVVIYHQDIISLAEENWQGFLSAAVLLAVIYLTL